MSTLFATHSSHRPSAQKRATHSARTVLLLSMLLMAGTSCEQLDDVESIFEANSWSFTGFCYTANWDKGECSMLNIDYKGKESYYLHTITFYTSGAADISMPGCTLSAHWKANGKDRSFALTDVRVVNGSLSDLTPFSRKFYEELTGAIWYRGNSLNLQLFNADEHYYLLFAPIYVQ